MREILQFLTEHPILALMLLVWLIGGITSGARQRRQAGRTAPPPAPRPPRPKPETWEDASRRDTGAQVLEDLDPRDDADEIAQRIRDLLSGPQQRVEQLTQSLPRPEAAERTVGRLVELQNSLKMGADEFGEGAFEKFHGLELQIAEPRALVGLRRVRQGKASLPFGLSPHGMVLAGLILGPSRAIQGWSDSQTDRIY